MFHLTLWRKPRSAGLGAIALLLGLAPPSCQALRPTTFPHVWLVDDGMHAGLLLDTASLKLNRDLASGTTFARAKFIEFGFSEKRWTRGDYSAINDLLANPLGQHDGVLLVQAHLNWKDATAKRRCVELEATPAEIECVLASIASWIQRPMHAEQSDLTPALWIVDSSQRYSALVNCRSFVGIHLRTSGIETRELTRMK